MSLALAMTDTIYLREVEGHDQQGRESYGEPEPYKARVQKVQEESMGADGSQRVSSHVIYVDEYIPVDVLVFLPGEDPEDTTGGHTPISVEESSAIAFNLTLTKITV